ncbi:MAG: hypothetical protein ACFFEV_05170 [Candidatus Thorarchaeota archaeon]
MTKNVEYPQTPEAWQEWIFTHLDISAENGSILTKDNRFPFDILVSLWNREFGEENGYSPSFIPALTRNKQGFIEWVYLGHPEPNWSKSDND